MKQHGVLRYSQDHRSSGYYYQKVKPGSVQASTTTISLTPEDMVEVNAILQSDLTKRLGYNAADASKIVAKKNSYSCRIFGADITDTLAFDCSSLGCAVYNWVLNTPFDSIWNSERFTNSSSLFSVSTDFSNIKPGDLLAKFDKKKGGHVAVYLGDCKGEGIEYIAEAHGIVKTGGDGRLRKVLVEYFSKHPEAIAEHPNHPKNSPRPEIQVPEDCIRDARQQISLTKYSVRKKAFTHVATYIGPIAKGRMADVTSFADLTTSNSGNSTAGGNAGSSDGTGNSEGTGGNGQGTTNEQMGTTSHAVVTLPDGNGAVKWPAGMVLEDDTLATSKGYFYKGTPTYGQYVGKIDMFNWLVSSTNDVFDWVIGFATYAIKATVIGWTAIMENVISNVLNFGITNETATNPTAMNSQIIKLNKIDSTGALCYTIDETFVPVATLATGTNQNSTSASNNSSNKSSTNTSSVKIDSEITASETKKKITIEDVLFNRVPILDINFFDFENAGGQKLEEGSLLYKIRETVASWYYTIRMTVIMGMLVVLLYIGVKIATSLPQARGEYKSKLVDWVVGFIVVFSVHYFMLAVISINNQVVKVLDPIVTKSTTVKSPSVSKGSNISTSDDGETSLYEAIRVQSYDIKATTGITATVMYIALVFFMIRFVILYAKRMFVIAVLTVISPIMGLLYAINKKKYRLDNWGKEYVFNVIIQFVHVVIYTAIVGFAFDLSKTSTFRGGIIALMTLAFIYGAEELVKKIFGFQKASTSGSLLNSALGQVAAIKVAQSIYDKGAERAKKTVNLLNSGNKFYKAKYTNFLHNNMDMSIWRNEQDRLRNPIVNRSDLENMPEEEQEQVEQEERENRAQAVLNSKGYKPNTTRINNVEYMLDKNGVPLAPYTPIDPDRTKYFNMSTINNRIEETLKEQSKARKEFARQGIKDIFNAITGSFSLMAAVPMLVVSPQFGLGLGAYGIHAITSTMGRRTIKGAKRPTKPRKLTGKRLVFAFSTLGASEGIANMYNNAADANYVLKTDYVERLEILKEARVIEDEIARKIAQIELEKKTVTIPTTSGEAPTEKVAEAQKKMKKVAKEMDKQEFKRAVNVTLQDVKKEDIKNVVEKYVTKEKEGNMTDADIENITKTLNKSIEGKYKDLKLNENFSSMVRDEIRTRVLKSGNYEVTSNVSAGEQNVQNTHTNMGNGTRNINDNRNNDDTAVNIMRDELRERMTNSSTHGATRNDSINEQKTENNNVRNRNTDTNKDNVTRNNINGNTNTADSIRNKYINDRNTTISNNVTVKNRITDEELEGKVNERIKNITKTELIDIMDTVIKEKGAVNKEIKNPKYANLMERVADLNRLNLRYKELTGEGMYKKYEIKNNEIEDKLDEDGNIEYQSVSEIVNNMKNYLTDYIDGRA